MEDTGVVCRDFGLAIPLPELRTEFELTSDTTGPGVVNSLSVRVYDALLTPSVQACMRFSDGELAFARFTGALNQKATYAFDASATGTLEFERRLLYQSPAGALGTIAFSAGVIPVWVFPTVSVYFEAEGELSSEFEVAATYGASMTSVGLTYDGQWNSLPTFQPDLQCNGAAWTVSGCVTASIEGRLTGRLTARLSFFVYGLGGPYFEGSGWAQLRGGADTSNGAFVDICGGLDLGYGLTANHQFFDTDVELGLRVPLVTPPPVLFTTRASTDDVECEHEDWVIQELEPLLGGTIGTPDGEITLAVSPGALSLRCNVCWRDSVDHW
jgi:hypothetical protein